MVSFQESLINYPHIIIMIIIVELNLDYQS